MWFIKHPIVLLYKGYKSSANYDGEPSVSKGIVSQLPSSHLSIHRVPAKLSNRVMPYGENYCKLQLLFVFFDFTDLPAPQGTDIPWTLTLPRFAGHCDDVALVALHRYRVSFQNPARSRNNPTSDKAFLISSLV